MKILQITFIILVILFSLIYTSWRMGINHAYMQFSSEECWVDNDTREIKCIVFID